MTSVCSIVSAEHAGVQRFLTRGFDDDRVLYSGVILLRCVLSVDDRREDCTSDAGENELLHDLPNVSMIRV